MGRKVIDLTLRVEGLGKVYKSHKDSYPTEVLKDINMELEEGEFVALMGPSGSGKTTCLNIFAGLDIPTKGLVEIDGCDISKYSEDEINAFRRQKLGFVFQDFNLLDSLTLQQNIMLPMILENRSYKEMEDKSMDLLNQLDISDIKGKYPYQVSGGEKQRAAIGRALINNPVLIFADEPTGNLDSKASRSIMEYLGKLNRELKCTILMVTHSPECASYCSKVLFIKDGRIDLELIRTSNQKLFYNDLLSYLADNGGGIDEL